VRKAVDGKISDEMFNTLLEIKGLLGISDDQAEVEARAAFGPELQKALLRATAEIVEDYTPELAKNMQKDIDAIMENYRLKDDFLREMGASYYAKAVSQISEKVSSTKGSVIVVCRVKLTKRESVACRNSDT
jgi:Glu-tRNA(Gln) amidotransferase subunit E-like FAD-binding protein